MVVIQVCANNNINDMKESEYCRKHNIILIAIPYTDEGRITYDYIMNAYYELGGY